jgi:hypothetical protein
VEVTAMKKVYTNIMDKNIIKECKIRDTRKAELGIELGAFTDDNEKGELPPYDETIEDYKKYQNAECIAVKCINNNVEIPDDIVKFLKDTVKERQKWHEYCKTHSRKIDDKALFDSLDEVFNS